MTKKQNILSTAALCTFISLLIFWDTTNYPAVEGQGFGQGPGFYPKLLATGLFFFGVSPLWRCFIGKSDDFSTNNKALEDFSSTQMRPNLPYIAIFFSILFVISLPLLGFILAGLLLATTIALLVRGQFTLKSVSLSILAGILIIFLVWIVFSFSIGIELPASQIF